MIMQIVVLQKPYFIYLGGRDNCFRKSTIYQDLDFVFMQVMFYAYLYKIYGYIWVYSQLFN